MIRDCLYALQPSLPHLTRSSLHRCLQRQGISQLPQVEGEASVKRKFKVHPIGFFHIDIAEIRTEQGKFYLLVAIDRTSKLAFVEVHEKVARGPPPVDLASGSPHGLLQLHRGMGQPSPAALGTRSPSAYEAALETANTEPELPKPANT